MIIIKKEENFAENEKISLKKIQPYDIIVLKIVGKRGLLNVKRYESKIKV